ncbi:MAG: hypothetical protein H6Q12_689 [Bacteroidetes bacterium]|nr:hypothetical protein [Bacteroidota bacterium]
MKKLLLLLVIILGCNMLTMAQDSKVSWNAKAGLNISNWTGGDSEGTDAKLGFKVGVGMEYAFDNIWSLQPSLFLSTKGTKYSEVIEGYSTKLTVNQMYLELPVNIQARVHIEGETNLLFSAGPYIAYGIGGKTSFDISNIGTDIDTFGNDGLGLDEFDAGLGFGVGLEFGKVLVGLDGQVGLTKLKDVEGAAKNINFSVTLGYKF